VLRGVEGFGANSRSIHTARILRLSEDLPILIEIVDTEDKIQAFLPVVDGLLERSGCGAMVTLEKVQVLHYGPSETSRGM
jgi:PII-like signaling protein